MIAAGADATPRGWACVALTENGALARLVPPEPEAILRAWPDAVIIGVDIPIGLAQAGHRRADLEARKFVGARAASVWLTPTRAELEAESRGPHLSLQAYGMRRRIFEVERADDGRFREVHPEVTFAFLNERKPLAPKRTLAGITQRLALLEHAGISPPPLTVPADDLLDAVAVAWSARRIARSEHATLPGDPALGEPVISY
ncbi:MAG TPA: DUF429 domain-containing protein [Candidatus Dormibacteraeota bacterium]